MEPHFFKGTEKVIERSKTSKSDKMGESRDRRGAPDLASHTFGLYKVKK